MNLANKLTLLRVILAPAFFIVYITPYYLNHLNLYYENLIKWTVPILCLIYIVAEITDYLDGLAARKLNLTSDFGKLFDPFADTLMQLTCFLCFVYSGLFPIYLYILIIYREFGILFLRNLMLKKGITMGARMGGKIKTVSYITAGTAALITESLWRLSLFKPIIPYFVTGTLIIFIISVIISIVSFIDYILVYRKTVKDAQ
jgi:CDP-diacylglycerol--glycerol-3-phosphate 3-phosphatidyltransferase